MKIKKIKKQTHPALVVDLIENCDGQLKSVEWECSMPDCDNTGNTREMYCLDISPAGYHRPINNAVLCQKCARQIARIKITRHKRASVYHLIDMIEWLKKIKNIK